MSFQLFREGCSKVPYYRNVVCQDGYAVVASDGPGEYPVITESRAGNDGFGVTVTSGTVAYVTTGGKFIKFVCSYYLALSFFSLDIVQVLTYRG